jgi:hypothetical protein
MGRVSKILNEQESNDFREGQRYHEVPAMVQAVAPRGSMDMSEVGHDDPDMEKQHPQKKADESVAHAIEADEEHKESQPELIKPEHDTHDS